MRRLDSLLGAGGLGAVFRATLLLPGGVERRVVAKMLHTPEEHPWNSGVARLRGGDPMVAAYRSSLQLEHETLSRLPPGLAVRSWGLATAVGDLVSAGNCAVLVLEECVADMFTLTGLGLSHSIVEAERSSTGLSTENCPFLHHRLFRAFARAACELVVEFHKAGVFLRDFKPENLGLASAAGAPLLQLLDGDESGFFFAEASEAMAGLEGRGEEQDAPIPGPHEEVAVETDHARARSPRAAGAGGDERAAPRPGSREWYNLEMGRALARDPAAAEHYAHVPTATVKHKTRQMQSFDEFFPTVDPIACNGAALGFCLWVACRGGCALAEPSAGFADEGSSARRWLQSQFASLSNAVALCLSYEGKPVLRPSDDLATWRATSAQVRAFLVRQEQRFRETGRDLTLPVSLHRTQTGEYERRPCFRFFDNVPASVIHPENPLNRPYVQRAILLLILPNSSVPASMSPIVALDNLTLFKGDYDQVSRRMNSGDIGAAAEAGAAAAAAAAAVAWSHAAAGAAADAHSPDRAADAAVAAGAAQGGGGAHAGAAAAAAPVEDETDWARRQFLRRLEWLRRSLPEEEEARWMDEEVRRRRMKLASRFCSSLPYLEDLASQFPDRFEQVRPFFSPARAMLGEGWPRKGRLGQVPLPENVFGGRSADEWLAERFSGRE